MAPSVLYAPLTHAKTNIRLVILFPGQRNEPIQCHLRVVSLSHAGRYQVLSYEWGPLNDVKYQISLNGNRFIVRRNLWLALKALRSERVAQPFWIDALCINQDGTTERNHQVRLMYDIYSGAHQVRVWLGESRHEKSGHDSSVAIAFIKRLASSSYAPHQRPIDPWQSLLHLCHRTYWTRIWIVQELLLARKGTVHCGNDQVDLSEYTRAQAVLARMAKSWHAPDATREILKSPAMTFLHKRQRNNKFGIFELLDAFKESQCGVKHDKLYALLGLAMDIPADLFVIDYRLPLFDVAANLVLLYQKLNPKTTRSVDFLHEKVFDWMGLQSGVVKRKVKEAEGSWNESRGSEIEESEVDESEIEEGDNEGSEMEGDNSGSILLPPRGSLHARGVLDFSAQRTREQPSIETKCDVCGVLLRIIKAFKRHRRKDHNFRGHGPQPQHRRPREDSIFVSSISISSEESSPYVPYEPPNLGRRRLAAGISSACSECGNFFSSMTRFKKHRRLWHSNAPEPRCGGAVPVPIRKAEAASIRKEKSVCISIKFPPGHTRKRVVFDVLTSATIASLKRGLYDIERIPLDWQLLEYNGNIVKERMTAFECGLHDGSELYLFVKD